MRSQLSLSRVALAVFFLLLYACANEAERAGVKREGKNQKPISLIIDDFDEPSRAREYEPFRGEKVRSWEGYGIYLERANVLLKRVPVGGKDSALEIRFDFPTWGWLSVRKEFETVVDLSSYTGLVIEVQPEQVQNTQFRITLSDAMDQEHAQVHGADEMWWFDAPTELLSQRETVKSKLPLKTSTWR
jgi:hypothetical protein